MFSIIHSEKIPIKIWADSMEAGALQQAKNLANLPFAHSHIAIMPDCHEGYGMPIGGVLATRNVVIPNAVGVDIGCGMCAVQTDLTTINQKDLNRIRERIKQLIPVGFKHHTTPRDEKYMPDINSTMTMVSQEYESALYQLGTLGGGNHFIEIQKGSDGFVWIMLHSGSRNIGKKVADHYNKLAIRLNEKSELKLDKKWQLSFLPLLSEEGKNYLDEMHFCVEFAFSNRQIMMEEVKKCFKECLGNISFAPLINIAHNYARLENHFGMDVVIHRKGAISARNGEFGIIPGSQGSKSFIVEGLGNPDSFMSCSHGAGRVMGRKDAIRKLDLEKEISKLEKLGVIHGISKQGDLDEAPSAYKNIDRVMDLQKDLVSIRVELNPMAVVKG